MSSKIKICKSEKEGSTLYTIRFFVFDPKKHFISTPEAKDLCRKEMHCSKKKMEEEYDSFYGVWMKIGRGKNAHIEFNKSTKEASNVIFIIPKKHRREAWKTIGNVEIPYSFIKANHDWLKDFK